MSETANDTIAVSLGRIEVTLEDIKRRLQEMGEQAQAHSVLIQEQRVRCEGCRRDIETCRDTDKTLYARLTRTETRLDQAEGAVSAWRLVFAALGTLALIATGFLAVWWKR